MKTDVMIIGAGPTGLALACQLIRHKVDFVIVDKNETTTPHSKAIGIQARTLEIYEQIGIADELVDRGTIATKARMIEGGKVRGEVSFGEFGKGMSPYPYLLFVEQGTHEQILDEFIKSNNTSIRWRTELESFSQDDAGVIANFKTADGRTETIEAKFLVGCDGPSSLVRHTLGLSFKGGTSERLFYVADVEIDWGFSHDALHVCLAQSSVTAFFPMRGGDTNYRIVGVFPEGHEADETEIVYDEVERQIVEDTELDLDITRVNWFSVYKVHSRRVNRFSKGRCILAGDSAHIHTPAGAQGMNTGIQDGYNLAWKLAMVLNGSTDLKILDTYNDERLANAERLLETTDRLFNLAASPNVFIAFLRTRVLPYVANFALSLDRVQRYLFPLVSQIGINYRSSSLSVDDASFSIRAGDRMPYFLIDGKSIYDGLQNPNFHLLIFSDGSSRVPDPLNIDDTTDVRVLPLHANIAGIFGTTRSFTVLVRPDNYIGYISSGVSVDGVKVYLNQIKPAA
ncbi:MAG: FAD-dependent monooxygenase [Pyrinomonadaceae bacterium]